MYDLGGEQLSSGYSSTDRDSCYMAESVDDRCAPRLATLSAGRDEGGSSEEEEEEGGGARPRPRLGRRRRARAHTHAHAHAYAAQAEPLERSWTEPTVLASASEVVPSCGNQHITRSGSPPWSANSKAPLECTKHALLQ